MNRAAIQREKLLNAIIFFVKNTRRCNKLKLFKLLFSFDFGIYRETGRSPTGLEYRAWPMGPVPAKLYAELEAPDQDMKTVLKITAAGADPDFPNKRMLTFMPRREFDDGCFTKREMRILRQVAEVYQDATADQMSEASHLRGQPWHQVYEVEKRPQAVIPYVLALDSRPGSISREQADEIAREEREARLLFG